MVLVEPAELVEVEEHNRERWPSVLAEPPSAAFSR
jgi:hypothetical protein